MEQSIALLHKNHSYCSKNLLSSLTISSVLSSGILHKILFCRYCILRTPVQIMVWHETQKTCVSGKVLSARSRCIQISESAALSQTLNREFWSVLDEINGWSNGSRVNKQNLDHGMCGICRLVSYVGLEFQSVPLFLLTCILKIVTCSW